MKNLKIIVAGILLKTNILKNNNHYCLLALPEVLKNSGSGRALFYLNYDNRISHRANNIADIHLYTQRQFLLPWQKYAA